MKQIAWLFAVLLVLSACGSRKKVVRDGYSHLRELPVIKPRYTEDLVANYKMYAVSPTEAICFVEIDPAGLLNKRDSLDHWVRNASFELKIKKNPLSKEIQFQSEKTWSFQGDQKFIDSFRFELPQQEDTWFDITYSDLNKHTYFQEQRWWLRKRKLIQQHFTLLNKRGVPEIQAYCAADTLKIESRYFNDSLLEFLRYDHLDRPALSPFAFGNAQPDFQKPDSVFRKAFANNRVDIPLKDGFLMIRRPQQPGQTAGFFSYSGDTNALAIQSMAYICSHAEIEKLKDPTQAKAVFDQFWEKAGGNDRYRSERLRREFIRRVNYTNALYSSYKPGCLTDRGMIYIVYGEPERILKEGFQEIWSYKSSGIDHINFVFVYDQDQIAPNNCYLERSQHYKGTYYISVENWRNGLIPL